MKKLPSGWEMWDKIENFQQELRPGESTKSTRKIHGVLFFIPHSILNDPNQSQIIELVKQNLAIMISKGKN